MIIVHPDLLTSSVQSILHDPKNKIESFNRIKQDNPVLWSLVEFVIDSDEFSEEFKDGYCRAAFCFYKLIEAQMECNELAGK